MPKPNKTKTIKAWAIVQSDGHIWSFGDGQLHIFHQKQDAKKSLKNIVGQGFIKEITYSLNKE